MGHKGLFDVTRSQTTMEKQGYVPPDVDRGCPLLSGLYEILHESKQQTQAFHLSETQLFFLCKTTGAHTRDTITMGFSRYGSGVCTRKQQSVAEIAVEEPRARCSSRQKNTGYFASFPHPSYKISSDHKPMHAVCQPMDRVEAGVGMHHRTKENAAWLHLPVPRWKGALHSSCGFSFPSMPLSSPTASSAHHG